jgi:hypothetical protein
MVRRSLGLCLAVLMVFAGTALGADQVLRPNRTFDDGWHTRPARLSVGQVLNEDCRQPILSACIANNTDFAFGDRIRERYEIGFQDPTGASSPDDVMAGRVWILARHPRTGTRSEYAIRILNSAGERIIIARKANVHASGWFSTDVPPITVTEAAHLALAGRVTRGTKPLAKNYVAYAELHFVQ